jgi:corrinoid protein of di/trimethylamine methyltransferase
MEGKMALMEEKERIIEDIRKAVVSYDEERCMNACREALAAGIDASEAVLKGLTAGMHEAGDLYSRKEYFVPELLLCSEALNAGMKILRPHLETKSFLTKGKIILGVVEGDVHDIGKNLVRLMFEGAGWDVYDLGTNVKLDRFLEKQQQIQADIIGVSALMTTTMVAIPKLIEKLKTKGFGAKILIGGAPITQKIADQFGADGYAPDAFLAVRKAVDLMGR